MPFSPSPQEEKFLDAGLSWNLDRLYADLATIKQKPLSATERICLRGLLCGLDPKEIAAALHRQPQGLRVDLTRGLYRHIEAIANKPVKNWRDVVVFLEREGYRQLNDTDKPDSSSHQPSTEDSSEITSSDEDGNERPTVQLCDWGNAPDVSMFFGRTLELEQLQQWVIHDRCRTVALVGMGGIGKTDLSLTLAHTVQDQFEFVIWRSLLNAPPLLDLLTDLIRYLSRQEHSIPPANLEAGISSLLRYLQTHRCLLILDNLETLLQEADPTGKYKVGYEGYGQLFQQLGTVSHQSCVLVTSREKSGEIARLEGKTRPVRSLELQGLDLENSKAIFIALGDFSTSDAEWQQLIEFYNGNPLALELVAKHIKDAFDGDITAFLRDGTPLFHDLQDLLNWHFDRLSDAEQEMMYWLAIDREAVTPADLKKDLLSSTAKANVSATLQALQRRFPLERTGNRFTLQPAVMEYVTHRLVKQICHEIITLKIQVLNQYAFVKAQAKDYIRESQIRIFVELILASLQAQFHNRTAIVHQLQAVLEELKKHFANLPGYGGGNLINLLRHFQVDLTGYDFSHLSIWQADLTDIKLHHVNFTGANLTNSTFADTFGGVSCVAFSPDGQTLASSDTSGEVQLWHVTTGQQQIALNADAVWTWAVAFSLDGQILATAGDDYQVKLWDVTTGKNLGILEGHRNTINTIAFSPTDPLIASAGQDATIRLWSPDRKTCVGILQGHQGRIWAIAFSPDGQTLMSGSEDCTLKQWDIRSGTCLQTWAGHPQWIKSVAFSADGQWVASGSFDGTIRLWEAATGNCIHTWQAHQNCVTSVAFRPGTVAEPSDLLASSSYDQMVKLWNIPAGTCCKAWQAHSNRVWWVAFSPDGVHLASGGEDHATRLWDIQVGQSTKTWKGHTNGVLSLAISPNQDYLATGHEDQTIALWQLKTGEIQQTLRGHDNRVWSVAFTSTQTLSHPLMLASGSADRTVKLWDAVTGECLHTLRGHQSWVWSVAFNPTGDWLASASYDQTIRLWSVETGECLWVLSGHTAPVVCATFSPNGRLLATSSFDTTIKIWDLPSGQCIQTLKGHQHSVWAIAFHPNGQQLASCSYDQTIKLWDVSRGECIHTFAGHTAPVVCLAFGRNGQQLVSGSFDRTVKLWNIHTGQLLHTFKGHTKIVSSVLFKEIAPAHTSFLTQNDMQALVISTSFDETIRFWNTNSQSSLAFLRASRPYENMNISEVIGLTDAQKITLRALGALDL